MWKTLAGRSDGRMFDYPGRQRASCARLANAHATHLCHRCRTGVAVSQDGEVPVTHQHNGVALAVWVITPPYARFSHVVNVRRLSPREFPIGTVFGLEAEARTDDPTALRDSILCLRQRFPAVPLVLRLRQRFDVRTAHLIQRATQLHVRGVIIEGEPLPDTLRACLTAPVDLPGDVVDWLTLRLPRLSPHVAELCRVIFRHAPHEAQLEVLLRHAGESSRTARSRLRKLALPAPAHWHQVARAVHAALRLQRCPSESLFELAMQLGYSDHSALSHQLQRLFGMRSSQVRRLLGWEWLLESWIVRHTKPALAAS